MINRVVLVGRLTRDPELRPTGAGSSFCTFTVAVDNRFKNEDGNVGASFIPCICFQKTADNVSKSLRKGSLVGVEGRLNQRSFVRKDGTKGTAIEVICDSVQFLEPKGDKAAENTETFDDFNQVPNNDDSLSATDIPDDDLPF